MTVQTFIITAERAGLACQDSAAALEHRITEALSQHGEDGTAWVMIGAHARVVRRGDIRGRMGVAWPIQTSLDVPRETMDQWLAATRTQLTSELNDLSGVLCGPAILGPGWEVHIQPFDPVLNGPLSWWQSGEAADTATRDRAVPSWLDYFNPALGNESLARPDRPVRTVAAMARQGSGLGSTITNAAVTVMWVGLGGVALYGLAKIVRGTSFQEPPPPPQQLGPGGWAPQAPAAPARLTLAQRHVRSLPGLATGYR